MITSSLVIKEEYKYRVFLLPTILKYLISVSERGLGRGLDIEAVRSSGLVDLLKGEYSRARPLLLAKANVIQIQI